MSLGVWLSGVTAFGYFPALVVLCAFGVINWPTGWVQVVLAVMWVVVVWLWVDARRLQRRTRTL